MYTWYQYEWLDRNEYLLRLHGYIVRYCRKSHATMSIGRRLWSLHSLWSEVKAGVQVEVDGEDHGGVDVEGETRPLLSMESFPLIPIICDHWICGISNTHFPSTITVRGAYCDVKEVTWFFLIFDLVGAVNPWGLGLWLFDNVLQIEQPCIIPELLSTSLLISLDSCLLLFKRGHLAHIKQILLSYPGGQKFTSL